MVSPEASKVKELLEIDLKKKKRTALQNISSHVDGFFLRMGGRVMRITSKALLVAAVWGALSGPVSAMSRQTYEHFQNAAKTAQLIQTESRKQIDLQKQIQLNPATTDSVALKETNARIDSLMQSANKEIELALKSFSYDLDNLIYDGNFDRIKADIEILRQFGHRLKDSEFTKEVEELEAYVKKLIDKRIVVEHIVSAADEHAKSGNIIGARKEMDKAFDMIKKYPHLEKYIVVAYMVLFDDIAESVWNDVKYKEYNKIKEDLREFMKLINHTNVDHNIRKHLKEEAKHKLKVLAESMLLDATKDAEYKEYDKTEQIIDRIKSEFKDANVDSVINAYEGKIAKLMVKDAVNESVYDFEKAERILKRAEKRYPHHKKTIYDGRYEVGIKMIEHVEYLVSTREYEKALKFLEDKEAHYWRGVQKELRKRCANIIRQHARGARGDKAAQKILKWARGFEEGRGFIGRFF